MQLIANGPDIPDALLEAHEEGRVVFFCGAGVSNPAGLPSFKGLVDDIYRRLGTTLSETEREVYERDQFDATLGLLEQRSPGGRVEVRKRLMEVLQPKLRRRGAIDTHAALLQLGRNREGALRLVTTNFDRVFEHVAKRSKEPPCSYAAPMLPVPKNSRWNGLVYLHGLLPAQMDDSALHRLVLSSGDFGLAYLTERWAARFVTELFRNYVVCFVGYSINDPVLRYMMDALAADRMLGETIPQAYAFGDCESGRDESKTIEWQAKGVTPILYDVPSGGRDHSALHRTLKTWAEIYRDGILGKERIVVEYALARPSRSTRQDDFVGRMLWAISHLSGLPAKRFAKHDPAPPLEWLVAFSEERFQHSDLNRFGVPPLGLADSKLQFSLVRRPAPYTHASWMSLAASGSQGQWDDVLFWIARWLTRHLNNPRLVYWLLERGSQLHEGFCAQLERKLDEIAKLELENKTSELDEMRARSPHAIPSQKMRTLWRLFTAGRVKPSLRYRDLYGWVDRLKRDGLSTSLRFELRELLAPMISLRKPFRAANEDEPGEAHERFSQLVDWDLVLAADSVRSALPGPTDIWWMQALPALLEDFQQLLRDALDLRHEMDDDRPSVQSHWVLPSISPHPQNQGFHDWAVLIELVRDAWLAIQSDEPSRATRIAQGWFQLPYPTFKRLAFFAAWHGGITPEQWVDWLLTDRACWLWAVDTRREVLRLLVLQGQQVASMQQRLEEAILAGPPREICRDDLEPQRLRELLEHSVWLLLAKLGSSGLCLGQAARDRLAAISAAHPLWQLAEDERDEFSFWVYGTGDPDVEQQKAREPVPRSQRELVQWLKHSPAGQRRFHQDEDGWRNACRHKFLHCLCALAELAEEDEWPEKRWQDALETWSRGRSLQRRWRYAAPVVRTMPDNVLNELAHSITTWLESISESINCNEDVLFQLCRRVLDLQPESESVSAPDSEPPRQPLIEAVNHPVGRVAHALLNLWFKREPNDNDGLPTDIGPLFTRLCDAPADRFRHGRVLLASRLVALFRVDRSWTEKYLLPLFSWSASPVEAKGAWEGFLWSPRLYQPLLVALKTQFLETAHRYGELSADHGRQFATLLLYAALEPIEGYTALEFQSAFQALPPEGLQAVARALWQALESADQQRETYWNNRVRPFWLDCWPKSRNLFSEPLAQSLALMSIAAAGEFSSALGTVGSWLLPIEQSHYVMKKLRKSGLCAQFPGDALRLLTAIVDGQHWLSSDFRACLKSITQTDPNLREDHRYRKLSQYAMEQSIS